MDEPVCPSDGRWCTLVSNITNNDTLAQAANWLIAKPLAILALIIAAWIVRWIVHRLINRLVKRATRGTVPGVISRSRYHQRMVEQNRAAYERRSQRAATMGSLLRSISTVIIAVIALFMIVGQLGYNIAPLIASAGIIGVAIAFGAQSLVQDFLSGIFMIMEDQFGVGDWIQIGTVVAEVEAVGLRVTRMRDTDGTVWYIRNGEVRSVGNMSQNWARAVLDIQVGYDEDLDRIRDTLHEVARNLADDAEYRSDIIGEPEVWGVQSLDPDRVLMRLALVTAPLKQWGVGRELRRRIKARFDADGIQIPLPQQVIHTTADDEPVRAAEQAQ